MRQKCPMCPCKMFCAIGMGSWRESVIWIGTWEINITLERSQHEPYEKAHAQFGWNFKASWLFEMKMGVP